MKPPFWILLSAIILSSLSLPISGTIAAAPAVHYPKINLKTDCGAKGDGRSNDTVAFQKAARFIQEKGGGTLIIPKAVYIVGEQKHVEGQTPYYQPQSIFQVKNVNYLRIEGNGATLRFTPGLHYGAFDPKTGQTYDKMPDYDPQYAVGIGVMFDISHSHHVTVRHLDLDGNSSTYTLGGGWGDTGRQLPAEGLLFYGDTDVQVSRVHSHHQGLDGIMIGWTGLKESDAPTPHTLTDCTFDYNGRQGLSWVGGRGLTAIRCQFNHTGRVKVGETVLSSAPGAGVDIEAEDSVCRDGDFEDCEFVDNAGCGLVSGSGNGGYSRFLRCTFWGTTNWSVWSDRPGLKYQGCKFYGCAVHMFGSPDPNLATSFSLCRFEDKPWINGKVFGRFLLDSDLSSSDNVHIDNCSFLAHAPARHLVRFMVSKPIITHCSGLPR